MRSIWFIRHAQSEGNVGLPSIDVNTIGLTELGHQQAQYVAHAFDRQPDLLVTSPYTRTKLTAQPALERFPTVVHKEWSIQEFTYLAAARCVNTTIKQRKPMADEYWRRSDPQYIDGEGAECFANLIERVRAMKARLRSIDAQFTAIFTHGQFLRAMIWLQLIGDREINTLLMARFHFFDQSWETPNAGIIPAHLTDNGDLYLGAVRTDHLPPALAE